jgi:hypothetical protein
MYCKMYKKWENSRKKQDTANAVNQFLSQFDGEWVVNEVTSPASVWV